MRTAGRNGKGGLSARQREMLFVAAAFCLYLCRYAAYGFTYYPLLDDHIQYYWYPQMEGTFQNVFLHIGTISTRPLAGVFDVYVWGWLYLHAPWAILFVTAALTVAAVYFLKRILSDMDIHVGGVFYLILLFLPVGFEAQYWLSASSRVIVGMFFTGLSLLFFQRYNRGKRWYWLVLFAVAQLASYCFYEQTAILSFLLCCAYFFRTRQSWKMYLIPVLNGCIIAAYYLLMRNVGALSGRGAGLTLSELGPHIVFMAKEVYHVICMGAVTLNINGFLRGWALLLETPWLLLLIAVLSGVFAWLCGRERHEGMFSFWLGAAIALCSVLLFFVTKDSTLPFRAAYVPLIGVALMLGCLLSKLRFGRAVASVLVFVLAFGLNICNVSEMHDYREAALIDETICNNIIAALDEDTLTGARECYVVGAKRTYLDGIVEHREHIINATSSDWALTGAVRHYLKGNGYVEMIIPAEQITDEMLASGAQILILNDDFTVSRVEEH